jgi:hypothetical protein
MESCRRARFRQRAIPAEDPWGWTWLGAVAENPICAGYQGDQRLERNAAMVAAGTNSSSQEWRRGPCT